MAARLRAVLRRSHGRPEPVWMHGALEFRPADKSVRWRGAAVALTAHGEDLRHDRQGHLLGAVGADVQADGSMDARVLVRTKRALGAQDAEDALRALARPEHAEVARGTAQQLAQIIRVVGEVVRHDDREAVAVEHDALHEPRRVGLDEQNAGREPVGREQRGTHLETELPGNDARGIQYIIDKRCLSARAPLHCIQSMFHASIVKLTGP